MSGIKINKKNEPLILSIVGKSDSGKTTLILKLLPELRKRKYRVAVAKHCPCGFDLDVEGKDSWKFTKAGAEGAFLSSEKEMVVIRPQEKGFHLKEQLQSYFSDFDIVFMEGYAYIAGIKKIQVIRQSIGAIDIPPDDIVAYVSDMNLRKIQPVFPLDDIMGIVSFIETLKKR